MTFDCHERSYSWVDVVAITATDFALSVRQAAGDPEIRSLRSAKSNGIKRHLFIALDAKQAREMAIVKAPKAA